MEREIREKLIEIARFKSTWTYSKLNGQLDLRLDFSTGQDRSLIGEWLGDISINEHQKGRPLLSVLVTHKGGNRGQGDGFYKLCEDLYGKDWKALKANKGWENQMIAECYTFWSDNENYKLYKNDY
jgi:hypothetical protein